MKKIISLLLAVVLQVSLLSIAAVAETTPVKEFVIDGVLDPWYLTNEKALELYPDDMNTYQVEWVDPYVKGGAGTGSAPFEDPETTMEVYTAYDDNYVYFYIKVWDDELLFWNAFEPDDYEMTTDSSTGDSIDIWFDPDPDSVNTYNISDPTADPVENGKKFYFCNNTKDERQGDVQCRVQGVLNPADNTVKIDDYHDYKTVDGVRTPIYRPGYNGQLFGDYIHNIENLAYFTFENEPVVVNEFTGQEVSSGYGVEVRFPRNDDESNSYYFNIAANNSSIYRDERYAIAVGAAWWMSYTSGLKVEYSDVNPFFNQPIDDGGNTPENPNVPNPPAPPVPTVTMGDINDDTKIDAKDALAVLKISVNKMQPTDDQKTAADVNEDNKIDAKDALEILKHSVNKPSALDKFKVEA